MPSDHEHLPDDHDEIAALFRDFVLDQAEHDHDFVRLATGQTLLNPVDALVESFSNVEGFVVVTFDEPPTEPEEED